MEVVGYITTVIVVFTIVVFTIHRVCFYWADKSPRPRLAGTVIPELGEGLDLAKRYEIAFASGYDQRGPVERLCDVRLVGYVGREDDESISKMYMRGRWLVVEFPDARKAYLMPESIVSLQESPVS